MFVRTVIGGVEALSDDATRIMAVVAVMHVECGLLRVAENWNDSVAQIRQRVERFM